MRKALLPTLIAALFATTAHAADSAAKQGAVRAVEKRASELVKMSDQIWAFAETALEETRSSALLADYAAKQGFKVQVATSGMSIGHKGMVYASKVLAATMVDLYEQPDRLAAVRADFAAKKGAVAFKPYLPDGPPPVPKNQAN